MSVTREVKERELRQGEDESIAYTLTTTPWGSTPTAIAVKAYDVTNSTRVDVSTAVLSGVVSTSGDVITLPLLQSLTAGKTYRLEVKFVSGGNTFEAYAVVVAEK